MVDFAEYFAKEFMNQPFSLSNIADMNEGFKSWSNYLIKYDIIPSNLHLQGLPIPKGKLIDSFETEQYLDNVLSATKELNSEVVLKVQTLTKGRGKSKGIKIIENDGDSFDVEKYCPNVSIAAKQLLEEYKGPKIYQVYVEQLIRNAKEFYLATVTDTSHRKPVFKWGLGGIDVEELAKRRDLQTIIINDITNPEDSLDKMKEVDDVNMKKVREVALNTYYRSWLFDLKQVEFNPLFIKDGQPILGDAKVIMDDDSVYRHPEIIERWNKTWKYQPTAIEKREMEAKAKGFSYVALENGTIGSVVNGAGLAMRTCDYFALHGLKPLNFCDLTGGATVEKVSEAVTLVASDPRIKGFLLNIHGGIVRTDLVVEGLLATKHILDEKKIPYVLRIIGTNEEKAYQLLETAKVHAYKDIGPAVQDLKKQLEKETN